MDLTEYLSWRQVAAYLLVLALYVAFGVFVGQYVYPALGISWRFLYWPDGRAVITPYVVGWSILLLAFGAIPLLRDRIVLTGLLAIAVGTPLTIGVLWLLGR